MLESWLFREREKIFDLVGQEDLKKILEKKTNACSYSTCFVIFNYHNMIYDLETHFEYSEISFW